VLLCIADPAIGPGMATLAAALVRGRPTAVLALRLLPAERTTTYLRSDPNEEEVEPLLAVQERGRALGVEIGALSFVSARPSADILHVADDQEAGIIILGFHRPLLTRTSLGGVVKDVLASASAPVGVLVDRDLSQIRRILVTLEDSPDGHAARAVAERLGAAPGVTLTGFRVVSPTAPVESRPDDLIRTLIVPTERPAQALLAEAAEGYDLVIVALGEAWDLSPTPNPLHAEQLVSKVPVSLLAVKAAHA
jgi:Universal stress protein family